MTRSARRVLVCAYFALVSAAGCGSDDVDLTGVYRVDADVGSMPCGADQPVMTPPPYLKFEQQEIFGTKYFAMLECSDEAATNCSGGGLFGDSFAEPIDGGWRGVVSSASGTTSCYYSFLEQTAKVDGMKLVVESNEYSEMTADATNCTAEEAEKRGKTMPCTTHERIDATKL